MKPLAESFIYLDDLLKNYERHTLSTQHIDALETAKKAILSIELMGIAVKDAKENLNS